MKRKQMAVLISCMLIIAGIPATNIYASGEFEGNEQDWLNKCSVAQSSASDAQKCQEFKEYYNLKSSNLESEIANMQQKSSNLASDLSNIRELIVELDQKIQNLDKQIASAEENVARMRQTIIDLDDRMAEKQLQIEQLDAQIKLRMESEQVNIGTNRYVDVLMGARDIVELIRLLEGISVITENDQEQMDDAAKARAELQLQQDEQKRLEADVQDQIMQNEDLRAVQEAGKKEQEKMYDKYYQAQQNVLQQMETAKADISSMQGAIAGINTNVRDDIFEQPKEEAPGQNENQPPEDGTDGGNNSSGSDDGGSSGGGSVPTPGNTSFIKPISYRRYCGTWYYPDGATPHLGTDYSGPAGAAVVAPAKSIVLYANDPYPSEQFGSSLGWPYGGGNTMQLLTQVNGTTYAISFFHLSKGILVSPGQLVEQGQVVAYSGASGNAYGAHLHVEVLNLGSMSVTQAQSRFAATADFAWGTGWNLSSTCSTRGTTPCRERPEDFFGY